MHSRPRSHPGMRSGRRSPACALTALAVVSADVLAGATPAAADANGTQVTIYDCNGGANQQWKTT